MATINKAAIEYEIHEAPSTPLNLKMGTIYSPRKADEFGGDFAGYSCVEVEKGWFVVAGWRQDRIVALYEGDSLIAAYNELAKALRMGS